MTLEQCLLTLLLVCGYAYWLFQLILLLRVARHVPLLADLPEEGESHWPRVSVIMTARNEEAALEHALQVRLTDDYPDLELVLVDDRSSDGTAAIADRLMAANAHLKVIHIDTLPAGWLGKLNAMQRGLAASSGEWLLFSDADVAVERGVLRRVIQHCERNGVDHCVVVPNCVGTSPLLEGIVALLVRLVCLNLRIWAIENPRKRTSVGLGAFNFVRRRALEKTQGLEWLKMEVADDLVLGQMLKDAGAKQTVVNGRGLISFSFQPSLRQALQAIERATYTTIGNFQPLRLVLVGLLFALLELSPYLALAMAASSVSAALSAGLLLVSLTAMLVANTWFRQPLWPLIFAPLAALFWSYACLRSGVVAKWRGGIIWRNTFYSEAELRAGRRVRL